MNINNINKSIIFIFIKCVLYEQVQKLMVESWKIYNRNHNLNCYRSMSNKQNHGLKRDVGEENRNRIIPQC